MMVLGRNENAQDLPVPFKLTDTILGHVMICLEGPGRASIK